MAARGVWLGGAMPLGCKNEGGTPIVVDAEAATVRLLFDLFVCERSAAVVRHQRRRGTIDATRSADVIGDSGRCTRQRDHTNDAS